MNTKEFIKELSERLHLPQKEVHQLLKAINETMLEALDSGKAVSIQKLGNFSVRKSESRKIFSPKLKKHVLTPPKKTLEFHPSISLKQQVKNIRTP